MEYATVKFGRPGEGETKEVTVESGTSVQSAMTQAGFADFDSSKESVAVKGSIDHDDGSTVSLDSSVEDSATYLIVPGIKSA